MADGPITGSRHDNIGCILSRMTFDDGGNVAGEQVLWRGKPERVFFLESADWLLMILGLVWIAFSVWLLTGTQVDSMRDLFRLGWRIALLMFGVVLTIGHPLRRAGRLGNTRYTVTDRRVIVDVDGIRPRSVSGYYDQLPAPVLREHRDEVGTIAFGEHPDVLDTVRSALIRRADPQMVLDGIWPADKVLQMIIRSRVGT